MSKWTAQLPYFLFIRYLPSPGFYGHRCMLTSALWNNGLQSTSKKATHLKETLKIQKLNLVLWDLSVIHSENFFSFKCLICKKKTARVPDLYLKSMNASCTLFRKLATLEADAARGNERADGAEKKIRFITFHSKGTSWFLITISDFIIPTSDQIGCQSWQSICVRPMS